MSYDYVSASLVGYNATDYVSLSESNSIGVSNFPFMAIAVQTGFDENHDGVLGMARQYYDKTDGTFLNNALFLESADIAGVITDELIGFYMTNTEG